MYLSARDQDYVRDHDPKLKIGIVTEGYVVTQLRIIPGRHGVHNLRFSKK